MERKRRAADTEDLELKELFDRCLGQSQAIRMDYPYLWTFVVSPILLLGHYKLENQTLPAALIMEVNEKRPV